jgi:hypothetical protein
MSSAFFATAFVGLIGFHSTAASDEGQPQSTGIAAEAARIFKARCAPCHRPELTKPKGRFGYVLDLRRLAGKPEMIVPYWPDESELLALIEHDEMPPDGAPVGPLSM